MVHRVLQYLFVAAAVLAPASGARAQPPSVAGLEAVYDFYLGGIRAGKLTVGADFSPSGVNSKIQAPISAGTKPIPRITTTVRIALSDKPKTGNSVSTTWMISQAATM